MTNFALPSDHLERMARVNLALDGLSTGDAFGQQFFHPVVFRAALKTRKPPFAPWRYTDDTVMALAICEVLSQRGAIDQDALAQNFAQRYRLEPHRGYGSGAHDILLEIGRGADWREASKKLFGGEGSLGNGAAMRVAPVGAYFADDFATVVTEARASAEVTHAHPDGQAGAIAIAVAVAWAHRWRASGCSLPITTLFEVVLDHTPDGNTRRGVVEASQLRLDEWEHTAANGLGNGGRVTSADTVPFCLWCSAARMSDYREALWSAVQVEGDIDTNCAIIGGIVATAVGANSLPQDWTRSRESLLRSSAAP